MSVECISTQRYAKYCKGVKLLTTMFNIHKYDKDGDRENIQDMNTQSPEDNEPNEDFAGIIRTVPGAVLIFKRESGDGKYEELWIYNVGGRDMRPGIRIRNSILAGTDIDPKTQRSDDGSQTCETVSVGNVQFLHIHGLTN